MYYDVDDEIVFLDSTLCAIDLLHDSKDNLMQW